MPFHLEPTDKYLKLFSDSHALTQVRQKIKEQVLKIGLLGEATVSSSYQNNI